MAFRTRQEHNQRKKGKGVSGEGRHHASVSETSEHLFFENLKDMCPRQWAWIWMAAVGLHGSFRGVTDTNLSVSESVSIFQSFDSDTDAGRLSPPGLS